MMRFGYRKKGFSLIEMIVSLGIIMLILILFFNIITSILDVAIKTNTRAQVREEVSNITSLLRADIRNANTITDCGEEGFEQNCRMVTSSEIITWRICDDEPDLICRYEEIEGIDQLTFQLSSDVTVNDFGFDVGFANSENETRQNIIFNISVSHQNENLAINNIVSNITTSTRNYSFSEAEANLQQCGNGIVERGEQCDDGNNSETDACLNDCTAAVCGDGIVQDGVEQCDDENTSNTDACTNTCRIARCGDGFRRIGVEQCDDGNRRNGDGCNSSCRREVAPPPPPPGGGGGGCTQSGGTCCEPGNSLNCDGCSVSGTCSPTDTFCGLSPGDNRRRCGGVRSNSVGCCLN